ncbi:hypothetical protein MRB53_040304 [Persea americana]|nr:hypothetical protein MRB53_040304 [Persea americana]
METYRRGPTCPARGSTRHAWGCWRQEEQGQCDLPQPKAPCHWPREQSSSRNHDENDEDPPPSRARSRRDCSIITYVAWLSYGSQHLDRAPLAGLHMIDMRPERLLWAQTATTTTQTVATDAAHRCTSALGPAEQQQQQQQQRPQPQPQTQADTGTTHGSSNAWFLAHCVRAHRLTFSCAPFALPHPHSTRPHPHPTTRRCKIEGLTSLRRPAPHHTHTRTHLHTLCSDGAWHSSAAPSAISNNTASMRPPHRKHKGPCF